LSFPADPAHSVALRTKLEQFHMTKGRQLRLHGTTCYIIVSTHYDADAFMLMIAINPGKGP